MKRVYLNKHLTFIIIEQIDIILLVFIVRAHKLVFNEFFMHNRKLDYNKNILLRSVLPD